MYLRHTTVRKNGKAHTYWRLVRSVRHGSKMRQETVAHLGELDARGRARASALAKHFLGRKTAQLELFDETPCEPLPVRLDQVRVERSRSFGDVWLGWVLWKALEGWQKRAGLGSSLRTVLEEMHRIPSVDGVLPLDDGREMKLRCVVRPDKAQAALLDRLGLELPRRLRRPLPAKM